MKKAIVILIISIFCFPVLAHAVDFQVELKGHSFSPKNKQFKDIYGGGIAFGGEFSLEADKNLDVWVEGISFSRTGELTFTKEETKLTIFRLGVGLRYEVSLSIIDFYATLGLAAFRYKESNPIGEVKDTELGVIAKAGCFIRITEYLFSDIYGGYSTCSADPLGKKISIGGLESGIGIGFKF